MQQKNKKKFHFEPDNEEEKTASHVYNDLVTFLMALFLLLFIVSQQSRHDGYFLFDAENKNKEPTNYISQNKNNESNQVITSLKNLKETNNLKDSMQIIETEQKVKIILKSPVLFKSGSAQLSTNAKNIIKEISKILKDVRNNIIIEGHTDNKPIKNENFKSNWELSFFRAYAVLDYMINSEKFNPINLSCQGFGEYSPMRPNTSAKNRAQNRRIEINIIRILSESERANQ